VDHPPPGSSAPLLGRPVEGPAEELAVQLERTVDRLRSMGIARLGASFEPEPTRADAAFAVVQRVADAAARLEGREPVAVPRLHDSAVGDQLAVCGRDLLAAAQAAPGPEADALLTDVAASLLDLRRRV
jgi:hypothetical protein